MATREHEGAKGKIQLEFDFYESASGHVDDTTVINIEAKNDNTLLLSESKSHTEIFKSRRNENHVEKYEISVNSLIELIKQNGTRV